MRVVCSYCEYSMGDAEPFDDPATTHAMCDACHAHFDRAWRALGLDGQIASYDGPALILDPDRRVMAANEAAAELLGKTPRDMLGLLEGEAFDCVNAGNPERCGNTPHCGACTIRNALVHSLDTGEPREGIEATLQRRSGRARLAIQTRRLSMGVELRILQLSLDANEA